MTLILLFAPLPTLALVNFVRVVHKHVRSERFLIWFSSVHGRLSLRLGEHMTGSAPRLWDLTGAEIELDGGPTSACAINVGDADANVRFESKADMCSATADVRCGPKADIRSSYSIISSARPINVLGTVMPSALAALRLMTSLNFAGCWIGRSDGLTPFKILST